MPIARLIPFGAVVGAALLANGVAPPLAAAQPRSASLAWSTYLRAGPAPTSRVLDELEHDARVQVLGCSPRWCEVTDGELRGYVDRDALDLPRPPSPGARPGPGAAVTQGAKPPATGSR